MKASSLSSIQKNSEKTITREGGVNDHLTHPHSLLKIGQGLMKRSIGTMQRDSEGGEEVTDETAPKIKKARDSPLSAVLASSAPDAADATDFTIASLDKPAGAGTSGEEKKLQALKLQLAAVPLTLGLWTTTNQTQTDGKLMPDEYATVLRDAGLGGVCCPTLHGARVELTDPSRRLQLALDFARRVERIERIDPRDVQILLPTDPPNVFTIRY